MTKKLCLRAAAVALSVLITLSSVVTVFALDYSGRQGNEATFELLEETKLSGPLAVAELEGNAGRNFKPHPALDNYPEGTTYIYRSPNMYGGRAAARVNTNILVFTDQSFKDKAAAREYLDKLGIIKIIDEAFGSVVLVTPSNPETGFGAADQKNYYALQTAMCAQKASARDSEGNMVVFADGEYYGGFGYFYLVGIDGGATFVNNFVSSTFDYVSRLAGMLLIGGTMEDVREVATFVPVYLVNAPENAEAKYKAANETTAYIKEGAVETYYNQTFPLRRVSVARDDAADPAKYLEDAYYNMFTHAMRVPVMKQGLNSASTPYQGYNTDAAPFALCPRNAVFGGVTRDGIHVIRRDEDRFKELATEEGAYLQTWFEYLPEEVLNGTAPDGTIPLILGTHGSGDDPNQFVEGFGLLTVAGRERIAIVSPEHQDISGENRTIELQALPALIKYMLETYPALDASRVYAIGYSMGAGAAMKAVYGGGDILAAAVPMSPIPGGAGLPYEPTDEDMAKYKTIDLPIMFSVSGYDLANTFDQKTQGITAPFQKLISRFAEANELGPISFDFESHKYSGFAGDRMVKTLMNGEFENITWYLNNDGGVPMVALNYTEALVHQLYPMYGEIAWNFMKHYSRDQLTGEILYDPYVK